MTDRTHPLMLSHRWGKQAEDNIDRWGNQNPGTILLAMVEELGEVAQELDAEADVHGLPNQAESDPDPEVVAWGYIHRMAKLGLEVRDFLDGTFEEPAGEAGPDRVDDLDIATGIDDADAVQDEVDDLGPLLYQMTWALQDGDADG